MKIITYIQACVENTDVNFYEFSTVWQVFANKSNCVFQVNSTANRTSMVQSGEKGYMHFVAWVVNFVRYYSLPSSNQ